MFSSDRKFFIKCFAVVAILSLFGGVLIAYLLMEPSMFQEIGEPVLGDIYMVG